MNEKLYTSSEVREILDISQRKLTHFAEKGLIVPVTEAKGAGSKRQYNYFNLLEFSLCGMLFEMELGIQLVKRILSDIRNDGTLKDWAQGAQGNYIQWKTSAIYQGDDEPNEGAQWTTSPADKLPIDTIYYIYSSHKTGKLQICKDITRVILPGKFPDLKEAYEIYGLTDFIGMIVVNLDRIKQRVDEGIKNVK